jgi:hypothetical protein
LKAKELLAEVLLYQHNQYQLLELFQIAREKKAQGKDVFAEWKESILPNTTSL